MSNGTARFRRAELPSDHFTTISNRWVRDKRLSWKARGILPWLASHKVGFRISENTLIAAAPDGKAAVRSAVKELEEHGYLVRDRKRRADGTLGGVEYILCDPFAASDGAKPQVRAKDRKSAPGEAGQVAPTADFQALAPTRENDASPQVAPTAENQPLDVTRENSASPQVGTKDRFSTPIRRTTTQKTKKKIKDENQASHLAVGAVADRNARDAVTTPPANLEDLPRLAGDVLGQMPDHYRAAPAWLRSRMLKRISEALADHEPLALVEYAHNFANDPNFGDYEHIRRFADVVRKLDADIAEGITCPSCGLDARHPFCTAGGA
ncbi:hypothetical protein [Streptosporangium canum]|uniref:hypothetical protein n=1 Tax=Streptosporangium canum TaxID=324952 RepID=UPI0033ACBA57